MALSIVSLVALWWHTPPGRLAVVLLRICVGAWAGTTAVHWSLFAVRNYAAGRSFAEAVATRLVNKDPSNHDMVSSSDVLRMDVSVPRPWRVKAGQSVLLSIPRLGILTGFRGHPFTISWWRRDRDGLTLSLLVQSRAGFTAELERHAGRRLLAFIDGPYGPPLNLGEHETVVMFASGVGIAGHMPHIKELISGYNSCEIRTRRVLVVWQLDEECEFSRPLVNHANHGRARAMGAGLDAGGAGRRHWLCKATPLVQGTQLTASSILEVWLHIPLAEGKDDDPGEHGRLHKRFSRPDIVNVLERELRRQKGRIIVCGKNSPPALLGAAANQGRSMRGTGHPRCRPQACASQAGKATPVGGVRFPAVIAENHNSSCQHRNSVQGVKRGASVYAWALALRGIFFVRNCFPSPSNQGTKSSLQSRLASNISRNHARMQLPSCDRPLRCAESVQ